MSIFARHLAVIVSWIGHPLVFVTWTVGFVLLTQLPWYSAIVISLVLLSLVVGPMALLLWLGLRSGHWQNADISKREERKRFFPIAIPILGLGTVIAWLADAPSYVLRGQIITLLLLLVVAVTNRRSKISLHTLFATYCTVIIFEVNAISGVIACLMTILVFWSRLALSRHSVMEVLIGAALGAAGGMVAVWMPV
jgi:hypothetical protein